MTVSSGFGFIDLIMYAVSIFSGIVLGFLFFGGLGLTLRYAGKVKHPGLLVIGSYFLRIIILFAGMVLMALKGGIIHLLVGAAGIAVVPFLFRLISRQDGKR
ncbi:MAG: ATP synthase subunit I [Spirochaetia bacterium]|jgi:F1F0 ATPase subunit 2|nr:ATP synthase subunit I [Spirochaetia bacterium]